MPKATHTSALATGADDDEYIARLLAKDARECSQRYAALGMYSAAPKRPTNAVSRPNTPFLKHIIQETDSHNANLKRREEEEAKARMSILWCNDRDKPRDRKRQRVKQLGDLSAKEERDLIRSRRVPIRRVKRVEGGTTSRQESSSGRRSRSPESAGRRKERREERHSRHVSKAESYNSDDGGHRRKSHRREDRQCDSDVADRSLCETPSASRHNKCKEERTKESYHSRRQHKGDTRSHRSIHHHTDRNNHNHSSLADIDSAHSSDSDPLSNLIGPLPPAANSTSTDPEPLRARGRGAHKATTSSRDIDTHFSATYDPATDVHLQNESITTKGKKPHAQVQVRPVPGLFNPLNDVEKRVDDKDDDDDWNMALEALRDRAVWRQKGAERLRDAGFEEDVIGRWEENRAFAGLRHESGSDDRDIESVKWKKRGEGREWDRGKVLDGDGHVSIKPSWADK